MAERSYLRKRGDTALWFALGGAPAAWFAALGITYFTVPWSCSHQSTLPLHITIVAALLIAMFAGYTAYEIWREEGKQWSGQAETREDRTRFLSEIAIGSTGFFGLLLIGNWVAVVILGPCIPLPRVPFTPDAALPVTDVLLAHVGAPLAPHDLWTAWSLDPALWLAFIWGGVLYGAGLRFAPRRLRRSAVAFTAGCVVAAAALLSPLHALSEALFSAHMVQHTLLIAVAAPLIVVGRPWLVSLWALPPAIRRKVVTHPVVHRMTRMLRFTPAQGFAIHAVVLWLWHVPALYQASLRSDVLHALQHTSFLLSAIAFWAAVFDARRRSTAYGAGTIYVFATAVHTSVLGALMTLATRSWYPDYAMTTGAWGLTPLEDQQLAGLVMWVPAGGLYAAIALVLLGQWLRHSEKRVRRSWLTAGAAMTLVVMMSGCDWSPGTAREALDARAAAGLTGGAPTEGKRAIERFGCGACHEIGGIRGADGLVGPPLNGVGRRMYVAGVLVNTPENMARWIHDPRAVDSLTAMPRLGVTLNQARDIVAYLYTLE